MNSHCRAASRGSFGISSILLTAIASLTFWSEPSRLVWADGSPDGAPVASSRQTPEWIWQSTDSLSASFAELTPPGMAVGISYRGKLVFAEGYGLADVENEVPATADTVFRIGSITKQFTAALVLRMMETGKLSLDDSVTQYIPDFAWQGHEVTVRQLLNHTSGIPSYTTVRPLTDTRYRLDLRHEKLLEIVKDRPFDFEPGKRFRYNNTGYYMLGMVIEKVAGQSYERVLQSEIVEPLRLNQTHYGHQGKIILRRAKGYRRFFGVDMNAFYLSMKQPFAAGALISTVADLLKWQHALAGGLVVKPETYRQMITPTALPDGKTENYGYGLGISELADQPVIQHGGGINGFTSFLARLPDLEVGIAVLVNSESVPAGRVAMKLAREMISNRDRAEKAL